MKKLLVPSAISFVAGITVGYLYFNNQAEDKSQKKYNTVSRDHYSKGYRISDQDDENRKVRKSVLFTQKNSLEHFANYSEEQLQDLAFEINRLPTHEKLVSQIHLYTARGREDPEGTLELMERKGLGLDPSTETTIKKAIYGFWAETDPEKAALDLTKYNSSFPVTYAEAIAVTWFKSDPEKALEYLKSVQDKGGLVLLKGYFEGVYNHNPELANQQFSQFSEQEQYIAIQGIAPSWGEQEQWSDIENNIQNLPESVQRVATNLALRGVVRKDLLEAQEVISSMEIDVAEKNTLVAEVLYDMLSKDLFGSIDWALENSSQNAHVYLTNRMYTSWKHKKGRVPRNFLYSHTTEGQAFISEASQSGSISDENMQKLKKLLPHR